MDEDWHKYRLLGEQAAASGNYAQAEAMWAMAALIAQGFAPKDPRFAFSLDNLGQVLARQGKFPLAENILGRSWQTKTQLNVSQVEAARTLNIVSELYFYQKRFEESEQLIARVLNVYQTIYGREHSHTQEVARNLTMIQQARAAASPTASSVVLSAVSAQGQQQAQPSQQQQLQQLQQQQLQQQQAQAATVQAPPAPPPVYRSIPMPQPAPVQAAAQASAPAIPPPNPNPGKPPTITLPRRAASFRNKCELCGFEIDGEWCGRCTGTSLKAISPENRLK
jgi:tetratricopeptide (TPR) repeat protein